MSSSILFFFSWIFERVLNSFYCNGSTQRLIPQTIALCRRNCTISVSPVPLHHKTFVTIRKIMCEDMENGCNGNYRRCPFDTSQRKMLNITKNGREKILDIMLHYVRDRRQSVSNFQEVSYCNLDVVAICDQINHRTVSSLQVLSTL